MEILLSDKQLIIDGDNRIQYDNTSAQEVITEINSDILTTASSGSPALHGSGRVKSHRLRVELIQLSAYPSHFA